MKKVILTILMVLLGTVAYAQYTEERVIYQPWDNGAFDIYYLAKGTETAASFTVGTDSISLTVAGGHNPGSMSFKLTTAQFNTFKLFQATMTTWSGTGGSVVTDDVAMEGTWVVTIPEDVYEDMPMSALATIDTTACLGRTNRVQLTIDASSTTIYSRYIPGDQSYKRTKIKYIITSFTGTTPVINIYNSAGTAQHPAVTLVSGDPTYIGTFEKTPIVIGGGGERLSIRMTSTGAVTAGYYLIGYVLE